jgi:uncharacterized membrane protein
MANRKLDMGLAWTQTTAMIAANRDTISALAGLFFFLPSLALALLAPDLVNPPSPPPGANPEAAAEVMVNQLSRIYTENWPIFLGLSVVQFIGSLSLLALLTDRTRPTVGEALAKGFASTLPYLAGQVLTSFVIGLAIALPLVLLAAIAGPAAAVLAGIVLVVLAFYLLIKFALLAPVVVIDGKRNPVAALKRSWQLTKGNSLRIAFFLALLTVVIAIIATLITAVFTLIFAAFGGTVAEIGNALVGGLVNAVVGVVFLVVIAAIHRQLSDDSPEKVSETFA